MQYSDVTNKTGVVEDMAFWCGSSNGTAPSDYNANDYKRNIRQWYQRAITWYLASKNNGWQFMDETATTDLVSGTRTYQLSAGAGLNISDLIQITRVEISYDGNNYYKATPVDMNSITDAALTDDDVDSKSGMNSQTKPYYILRREADTTGYIDIYPKPSAASANGLKIYYTENIGTFGNTATDVPLIPEYYHRIISLGAAYDFLKSRNEEKAESILRDINLLRGEMGQFDKQTDEIHVLRPSNLNQYT